MVGHATGLRRELRDAFEAVLQERLRDVPADERAGVASRLRDALSFALENAPARENVVGDLTARALLASIIDSTLGQDRRGERKP